MWSLLSPGHTVGASSWPHCDLVIPYTSVNRALPKRGMDMPPSLLARLGGLPSRICLFFILWGHGRSLFCPNHDRQAVVCGIQTGDSLHESPARYPSAIRATAQGLGCQFISCGRPSNPIRFHACACPERPHVLHLKGQPCKAAMATKDLCHPTGRSLVASRQGCHSAALPSLGIP